MVVEPRPPGPVAADGEAAEDEEDEDVLDLVGPRAHHETGLADQETQPDTDVNIPASSHRHELCSPDLLKVKSIFKKKSYEMDIEIPANCLEGYDPKSFDRMGFTYRINRQGGDPQHFALSSEYLAVEKESKRWSTVNL